MRPEGPPPAETGAPGPRALAHDGAKVPGLPAPRAEGRGTGRRRGLQRVLGQPSPTPGV